MPTKSRAATRQPDALAAISGLSEVGIRHDRKALQSSSSRRDTANQSEAEGFFNQLSVTSPPMRGFTCLKQAESQDRLSLMVEAWVSDLTTQSMEFAKSLSWHTPEHRKAVLLGKMRDILISRAAKDARARELLHVPAHIIEAKKKSDVEDKMLLANMVCDCVMRALLAMVDTGLEDTIPNTPASAERAESPTDTQAAPAIEFNPKQDIETDGESVLSQTSAQLAMNDQDCGVESEDTENYSGVGSRKFTIDPNSNITERDIDAEQTVGSKGGSGADGLPKSSSQRMIPVFDMTSLQDEAKPEASNERVNQATKPSTKPENATVQYVVPEQGTRSAPQTIWADGIPKVVPACVANLLRDVATCKKGRVKVRLETVRKLEKYLPDLAEKLTRDRTKSCINKMAFYTVAPDLKNTIRVKTVSTAN